MSASVTANQRGKRNGGIKKMVDVALGWQENLENWVRKAKGRRAWRDEAANVEPGDGWNTLFWFLENAQHRNYHPNRRLKLAELQPRSHTSVKEHKFGTPRCNHLNFAGPSW